MVLNLISAMNLEKWIGKEFRKMIASNFLSQNNVFYLLNFIYYCILQVSWTSQGLVKLSGAIVQGSNIVDLVKSTFYPISREEIPGIQKWAKTLKDLSATQLISNKAMRAFLNKPEKDIPQHFQAPLFSNKEDKKLPKRWFFLVQLGPNPAQ